MLAELSRREKEANIKPDSDIDIFLKVRKVDSQRPGFTLMVKKKKKRIERTACEFSFSFKCATSPLLVVTV